MKVTIEFQDNEPMLAEVMDLLLHVKQQSDKQKVNTDKSNIPVDEFVPEIACVYCEDICMDTREYKPSDKYPDFKCPSCNAVAWVQKDGKLNWRKGKIK
jgi:hypothetical protein